MSGAKTIIGENMYVPKLPDILSHLSYNEGATGETVYV
jgi:hypothetical protein